jgi:hypothetical protein
MKHDIDHHDEDHGFAAGGQHFVVLAHSPVPTDPAEGTLHDPTLGQDHEARDVVTPPHDFQDPAAQGFRPFHQFARIAAVGPNELQSGVQAAKPTQHELGSVAILHVGDMHDHYQDQPQRVDDQMPLAPFDLLARVVAPRSPFSVVLTVWLSMIAAEGETFRPSATRTLSRSAS